MAVENVVGLEVIDDDLYSKYREGMKPILYEHGGEFGYDFRVSEVLKTESSNKINRVFTIRFLDNETMNKFFSNENYLKVKKEFFEPAVKSTNIIASYTK